MRAIIAFFADDAAVSSIEYAMIAAGIAVVVVVAIGALGTAVNTDYATVAAAMK
jgi:pilus assembly protein Flp/PilA